MTIHLVVGKIFVDSKISVMKIRGADEAVPITVESLRGGGDKTLKPPREVGSFDATKQHSAGREFT